MVSTTHPTIDELRRWRRGEMEGEEVIAIGRHLATCDHCTTTATQALGLDDAADALLDDIARDGDHQKSVRPWLLALAASLLIVVVSGFWWTTRTLPRPIENRQSPFRSTTPAPTSGDASSALMARVRGGAPIGMPDVLRALRPKPDVLRGGSSTTDAFSPAGLVLKSAQPLFTWPAANGSRSTVQVFRGEEEVTSSGVLTASQWRPARMLARGVTYSWTVRVEKDGINEILPSSPAPPARFHIADANIFAALEIAERNHPGDHLLLGVLNALAGIEGEARAHLRRVDDPRDAAVARRVLREIDSWPSP